MRKIFFIAKIDLKTKTQVSGVFIATENNHKAAQKIKEYYPDYLDDKIYGYCVNALKPGQVDRLRGLKVMGRLLATDELAHVLKRVKRVIK